MGSALVLLTVKIVLSIGFVLVGTAAAERLGPRIGGLVNGLPQLSVAAPIFFALEQGRAFAAESAFWTIRGIRGTVAALLGFVVATERVRAPRAASVAVAIGAGVAAFGLGPTLVPGDAVAAAHLLGLVRVSGSMRERGIVGAA